jgi:hypothetical protein
MASANTPKHGKTHLSPSKASEGDNTSDAVSPEVGPRRIMRDRK